MVHGSWLLAIVVVWCCGSDVGCCGSDVKENLVKSPTPPPSPEPAFDGVLRTESDGRLSGYMIPPACPPGTPCVNSSSHCASLAVLPDGSLALGWFSGYREGWNFTSIVISYLSPGATKWTVPEVIARRSSFSSQNPLLFYDDVAGELVVFHVEQPSRSDDHESVKGDPVPQQESQGTLWVQTGKNVSSGIDWKWSNSTLFDGTKGTWGRNQILKKLDGSWMLPLYNESQKALGHQYEYSLLLHKPNDATITNVTRWDRLELNNSGYLVQPSMMRLHPASPNLLVFFRDRRALNIYRSSSSDDGYHWTDPVATALPNNNAGIHATGLESGTVVIVYNNMTGNPGHDLRNSLVVSLSDDGGITFPITRALDVHPATSTSTASVDGVRGATSTSTASVDGVRGDVGGIGPTSCDCYSYPWVSQSADGNIHIAYTYQRRTIKYVRVSEKWIRNGQI